MAEPIHIQRQLDHAQGYLLLKMYDDALAEVDQVLRERPDHREALYWRGLVLLEQHKLAEAEAPFRRLIEIDPEQAHVYVHLAYIYRRTVSLARAIETIQKALALSPSLPVALYNLACYRAVAGECAEALRLLRQTVAIEKEYRALARSDPDFDSVRGSAEFRSLIES